MANDMTPVDHIGSYRDLLEAVPDALLVIDEAGDITFANAETERLFGYPRNQLLGRQYEMLLPERFQGHHAEHLLLVVDESSGVDEGIFEAAAGYMTNPNARLLLIGNPTRTSGEFFDSFHSARGFYNTIHISALDTPAFTGERVPVEGGVGRHPAHPGGLGDDVGGRLPGQLPLAGGRGQGVGAEVVIAELVGVQVPEGGLDHLPRWSGPVER